MFLIYFRLTNKDYKIRIARIFLLPYAEILLEQLNVHQSKQIRQALVYWPHNKHLENYKIAIKLISQLEYKKI